MDGCGGKFPLGASAEFGYQMAGVKPSQKIWQKMVVRASLPVVLYLLAGILARQVPLVSGRDEMTIVWLPTGIALATVLLCGYRYTAVVFASAVIFSLIDGFSSPLVCLGFAVGNAIGALTAAVVLRRL